MDASLGDEVNGEGDEVIKADELNGAGWNGFAVSRTGTGASVASLCMAATAGLAKSGRSSMDSSNAVTGSGVVVVVVVVVVVEVVGLDVGRKRRRENWALLGVLTVSSVKESVLGVVDERCPSGRNFLLRSIGTPGLLWNTRSLVVLGACVVEDLLLERKFVK